ncbi:Spy/CpxP family protein refolding chaperone [Shewanella sedimentimangrovi]|uniref:Spy/CpxP family protein refolding chaperone n=1 Tax=Shewanella sedimentimangrovi TaxID=2814293 RepID=A0ABX7R2L4_9GAMM|nr:Spy/CpxP family protein refolding chaperone [Shewanella sedimentimangrovi]QSX37088.1 Spy/CpxP family protein refolding chaperone [Shewanella sedimentimangrovi]
MKKSKLTQGLLGLLATAMLLGGAVAVAHEHGEDRGRDRPGMHQGMRHMFRNLDLTDEQQAQIKSLMKEQRQARSEQQDESDREAHRNKMLALVSAAKFDENAARALIAEQQQHHEEGMLNFMKLQQQVYQLLTPEQQEKFRQQFAEHRGSKR